MAATLAEAVSDERVEMDVLHSRYRPVLNLVNVLIGVVPYCDRYLEIWQPGFRTYNLMVPNFLNLPGGLFGFSAPKDIVGLGMYASSRAASCNYCSAHTCSYALRRGSSADAVTGDDRTPAEQAVVDIAEALSTDPHQYRHELADELRRHYNDDDAEWIVMGTIMMGFLNKFMDAIGVELEAGAVNDVSALIEPTGWSIGQHGWAGVASPESNGSSAEALPPQDSMQTMLAVVRNAPGAIRLEKQWMEGIPKGAADCVALIQDRYKFNAEMIGHMRHAKPRRALTAMLRHNLDETQSELGIGLKALVGLVFARHMDNPNLVAQAKALAKHHGVADETIEAADGFFPGSSASADLDERTVAALSITRLMAPSPAMMDAETVEIAKQSLSPAEIIETAVWISVSQLMHRLTLYYGLDQETATI